ncbi:hypothetical protein [Aliivibrio fischeri]|uniref:hypothetical protein n=1 Tax=Aliivibrio fischeri TaxID=668 RepID=UPI0009BDDAC5|nr:hypothetical protein [Aliivibrio fischeri]
MSCNHEDLTEIMKQVGSYQGGKQRHVCAGCAYHLGIKHREQATPFNPGAVDDLKGSQGGPQRHKNAYEAYKLGFEGR